MFARKKICISEEGFKMYICIDLKSFYASAECAERGLDPFTVNLVVADPSRGKGALCLAVTPAMKSLGIRNRCRLFEIPGHVKYRIVRPHMRKYMEISAQIYGIYLKYISKEDIYVYSIDECFIDLEPYHKLYGKTAKEMAQMLMKAVFEGTGISSAAGIGTNLFLTKLALDITAKHSPERIGYLDEDAFMKTIWHHKPITDIWNIGNGIAGRLAKYGVHDLYGITRLDESLLYKEFGIYAEILIDHAYGREPCTIQDIKAYKPKTKSISNSQVLFEDYSFGPALLVMHEMVQGLILDLLKQELLTGGISLVVGYSKDIHSSSGGTLKFENYTDIPTEIEDAFDRLYKRKVIKNYPIRTIGISLNDVKTLEDGLFQTNLFVSPEKELKQKHLAQAVMEIQDQYGKNAILRGTSLLEKSTVRKRNTMIGGHNA